MTNTKGTNTPSSAEERRPLLAEEGALAPPPAYSAPAGGVKVASDSKGCSSCGCVDKKCPSSSEASPSPRCAKFKLLTRVIVAFFALTLTAHVLFPAATRRALCSVGVARHSHGCGHLRHVSDDSSSLSSSSEGEDNTDSSSGSANSASRAPLLVSPNGEHIEDHYIVVLKPHVEIETVVASHTALFRAQPAASRLESKFSRAFRGIRDIFSIDKDSDDEEYSAAAASSTGARKSKKYMHGYFGHFDAETVEQIRALPEVHYIEKDQVVHAYDVQRDAPWGLSRIAHRTLPEDETEMHKYLFDGHAGSGVNVYIVDTGINVKHVDFEGRAVWGKTIPEGDADEDGNGHGTHVAGTIGSKHYGVAKKASLVAVKVLRSDGSGTLSDVIKGIEWVITHYRKNGKKASGANMSLGGGKSPTLDSAVDAAVEAGIHFAVAAGNDNQDACYYSPAGSKYAITVGATTKEDDRAWFSNHGSCVDVFAPGHQILSTWKGSETATNIISGTSMASPHVAGLAALLLSEPSHQDLKPAALKKLIIKLSTKGTVHGMPFYSKTKNRLIFSDPPKGKKADGTDEDESVTESIFA